MLSSKAKRELKIDQRQILIDSIEIGIASPQQIYLRGSRQLPNGKKVGLIKNSKTVNYKRFTPFRDGLFCERIFGPVTSFVCACGKKQPHNKVTFCEKCEVEYIDQRSRRYRLGYISLLSPVTHIWYLKGRPSYLSLFLGKRKKTVVSLAYCNVYLIEHVPFQKDDERQVWPFIPSLFKTDNLLQNNSSKYKPNKLLAVSARASNPSSSGPSQADPVLCLSGGTTQPDFYTLDANNTSFCRNDRSSLRGDTNSFTSRRRMMQEETRTAFSRFLITSSKRKVKWVRRARTCNLCTNLRTRLSALRVSVDLSPEVIECKYPVREAVRFARFAKHPPTRASLAQPICKLSALNSSQIEGLCRINLAVRTMPCRAPTCSYGARQEGTSSCRASSCRAVSLHTEGVWDKEGQEGTQQGVARKKAQLRSKKAYGKRFASFAPSKEIASISNRVLALSRRSICRSVNPTHVPLFAMSFRNKKMHGNRCEAIKSIGNFYTESYAKYSYTRQQCLPFLPSFASHFYLRDALLNFIYSSPASDDIPLSEYCKTNRVEPLQDVHKFMARQTVDRLKSVGSLTFAPSSQTEGNTNRRFVKCAEYAKIKNPHTLCPHTFGVKGSQIGPRTRFDLCVLCSKFCCAKPRSRASSCIFLRAPACIEDARQLLAPTGHGTAQQGGAPFGRRRHNTRVPHTNLTAYFACPYLLLQSTARRAQDRFVIAMSLLAPTEHDKKMHGSHVPLLASKVHGSHRRCVRCVRCERGSQRLVLPCIFDAKKGTGRVCKTHRHTSEGNQLLRKKSQAYVKNTQQSTLTNTKDSLNQTLNEDNNTALSNLELTAIREILSYTGGGALQHLLKQFDPHDLCKFLVAEKQILRVLYQKHIASLGCASKMQEGAQASSACLVSFESDTQKSNILTPPSYPSLNSAKANPRSPLWGLQNGLCQTSLTPLKKDNITCKVKTLCAPGYSSTFTSQIEDFLTTQTDPKLSKPLYKRGTAQLTPSACEQDSARLSKNKALYDPLLCPPGKGSSCLLCPTHVPWGQGGARRCTASCTWKVPRKQYTNNPLGLPWELKSKTKQLYQKKEIVRISRRIYKVVRRLKVAQLLTLNHRRPEWMILSHLPVLPPDLRPILQMSEKVIVASDLNIMYQRVIYRNNRHLRVRFIDFQLVTAIQRLVQDAVDRLMENGKGGSKPYYTQGGRPLKSLSDILKGKKGRFRLNLLGKRVDFSGRSVIVVAPSLKIHECGLPKDIALELYHYFLLRQLIVKKYCASIVTAKKMIKSKSSEMWDILREVMYHHPVLLNRAPTLHRLGIQAFQPKLVVGNAIWLHPLVCSGFNADFDGDQMGVHLPLSFAARSESWDLLWSRNNLLSPATGQPMLVPSQDMVLGFYYMTAQGFANRFRNRIKSKTDYLKTEDTAITNRRLVFAVPCPYGASRGKKMHGTCVRTSNSFVFVNTKSIITNFQNGNIRLHTPVWLHWAGKIENENTSATPFELRVHGLGSQRYIYENLISSDLFTNTNSLCTDYSELPCRVVPLRGKKGQGGARRDIARTLNQRSVHHSCAPLAQGQTRAFTKISFIRGGRAKLGTHLTTNIVPPINKPNCVLNSDQSFTLQDDITTKKGKIDGFFICTQPKASYVRTTAGRVLMNNILKA